MQAKRTHKQTERYFLYLMPECGCMLPPSGGRCRHRGTAGPPAWPFARAAAQSSVEAAVERNAPALGSCLSQQPHVHARKPPPHPTPACPCPRPAPTLAAHWQAPGWPIPGRNHHPREEPKSRCAIDLQKLTHIRVGKGHACNQMALTPATHATICELFQN